MLRFLSIAFVVLLLMLPSYAETQSEILNRQGNDASRAGRLKEALPFYTKAIRIDPTYAEPYYNRGKVKLNLKDYAGAVQDLTAALRLTPKDADAYNNRGIAKRKLGNYSGAIQDYTNALKYKPTSWDIYLNRGISRYAVGDKTGACSDFHVAAKHNIPQANEALRQAGCL